MVTEPPRLHWRPGCSCLQLQWTCAGLQWGSVHLSSWKLFQPSLPLQNHLSNCMGEMGLDGPVLTVCLAHMPFFTISTISSEAVWGKGHPSTKWSKLPHWKHLWAEVLTAVALRIVAIRAWSVVVKGQLWWLHITQNLMSYIWTADQMNILSCCIIKFL